MCGAFDVVCGEGILRPLRNRCCLPDRGYQQANWYVCVVDNEQNSVRQIYRVTGEIEGEIDHRDSFTPPGHDTWHPFSGGWQQRASRRSEYNCVYLCSC